MFLSCAMRLSSSVYSTGHWLNFWVYLAAVSDRLPSLMRPRKCTRWRLVSLYRVLGLGGSGAGTGCSTGTGAGSLEDAAVSVVCSGGFGMGSTRTLGLITRFTLSLLPAGLPLPRLGSFAGAEGSTGASLGGSAGASGGTSGATSSATSDLSLAGSAIFCNKYIFFSTNGEKNLNRW